MVAIEIENLTKVYSTTFGKKIVKALDNLSLSVNDETIYGLLGRNGAGKTTLVKILMSITYQTSGQFTILGKSIKQHSVKKHIGYLPENHKFPPFLTGYEMLHYFGTMTGIEDDKLKKRIPEMLEMVKMSKWANKKIKTYSKGMMQRVGLAQAILHDPDLIFLDEPTDGVDPVGRKEIRDVLIELKNQKKTIFLNSHLLSEVEMVTDRIAILNNGKLIREGSVKELTDAEREYQIKTSDDLFSVLSDDEKNTFAISTDNKGNYFLPVNELKDLNAFIDLLRSREILISEIVPMKHTLEDTFITLVEEADKEVKA